MSDLNMPADPFDWCCLGEAPKKASRDIWHMVRQKSPTTVCGLPAADPDEAILAAESMTEHIDLLLTDVVMPGMRGPELATRLRETWPRLPVVLMSGYTEDEIVRHQAAIGEVRFLQKPVDLGTLAREIHAALSEGSS